jgi:hypothetical protein
MAQSRMWLSMGFLAGLCSVGIPYWSTPYDRLSLPGALIAPGILLVVLVPFLLRFFHKAEFWKAAVIMGAVMPAAVLLRVAVDVLNDPTSHNLWPLELVIAGALGMVCALAGSVTGSLAGALLRNEPASGGE